MRVYLFVVIFLFFVGSCRFKHDNSNLFREKPSIIRKYDTIGHLRIEVEISKDSVWNGLFKKYYPNGSIENIRFYKNGLKDSIEIWYYPNGIISEKYFNKDDSIDGWDTEFYSSGKVESMWYYRRGKNLGSSYKFYENGTIKNYYCYDNGGLLRFKQDYDSTGKITIEDGNGFVDIIHNKLPSTLVLGDTFVTTFFVISPPKQKRVLLIHRSTNSGNEQLIDSIQLGQLFSYQLKYYCGKHETITYRIGLKIEDSISHSIDTSYAVLYKAIVR